jgi:hypothetical protein
MKSIIFKKRFFRLEPTNAKRILIAIHHLILPQNTETEREMVRAEKIRHLLDSTSSTDLKELQSLSYSGLPFSVRGTAWKLLAVRIQLIE